MVVAQKHLGIGKQRPIPFGPQVLTMGSCSRWVGKSSFAFGCFPEWSSHVKGFLINTHVLELLFSIARNIWKSKVKLAGKLIK